jgi:transcriptional regulator
MHPDPRFHWNDPAAMQDFVTASGFGEIIVMTPEGLRATHLPYVMAGENALRFHIARSNIITPHLEGADALFIVNGPHAYISPDYYGIPEQVPTWNYVSVEINGSLHALDQDALVAQSDALTAHNEAQLAPKMPWSRNKMDSKRFDAMLPAIQAFELRITAMRGTRKLGQNKAAGVRQSVADHLTQAGQLAMADATLSTIPPIEEA